MAGVAAIWALSNEWLRRPEKGEPEHLARCDIVDTFIGPLVRVDRNGRYPAEWHDRVGRDGYAEGHCYRPAAGHAFVPTARGPSRSLYELRNCGLGSPADGEDALWLWLPRCSW
jgi:hypothetical protein